MFVLFFCDERLTGGHCRCDRPWYFEAEVDGLVKFVVRYESEIPSDRRNASCADLRAAYHAGHFMSHFSGTSEIKRFTTVTCT